MPVDRLDDLLLLGSVHTDKMSAFIQAETEQRVVYTISDDATAVSKLVYMEWLNQNRRIVRTKAISVVDGSVSKQQRNI